MRSRAMDRLEAEEGCTRVDVDPPSPYPPNVYGYKVHPKQVGDNAQTTGQAGWGGAGLETDPL